MPERDVRFSDKKVDEDWKHQAKPESLGPRVSESQTPPKTTSKPFLGLVSSLGYQALVHLGELEDPVTRSRKIQLEAAREMIDLLVALKAKTEGNRSTEENEALTELLAELQMKFASHL